MQTSLNDLRYALRQLRKSPGFAITAVLTLALGIGANTAIFTLVKGILLRSLPVADPSQLYRIGDTDDCCVNGGFVGDNGDFDIYSYDLYQHFKQTTPEFVQLAAVQAGQPMFSVRRGNQLAHELHGEYVSGNLFSTLGLMPYLGRLMSNADDQPNSPPVVVLSYKGWQGDFGGDPSIVGSAISIQAHPFTVIGIAPPGYFGDRVTDSPPDFWLPIATEPLVTGEDQSILHHPDSHWLYPIGRVKPATNIAALQAKLTGSLRQWLYSRSTYTDNGGSTLIPKQYVKVVPAGGGIQSMQQQAGTGLWMLMILSSVVLLIACANIANLTLARGTARRGETAIRMAVGASRLRVMRQAITECVVLSCLGGLAGLAVAYAGSRTILALAFPNAHNMPVSATPSFAVLGFTFLVSLVTGVLFGLAPAWLASHAQPAEALRGTNRTVRDRSSLPQKLLVVFQAALSIVLIAGAILMTKSLARLEKQDFGLATSNRYVMHFDPSGAGYGIERLPALYRSIEDRFSSLPGVAHVALAMYSPLEGDNWGECVIQQGHPAPGPNSHCGSTWVRVSPQYLGSIGVPVVRGRDLSEQDTATSQPVAVVNETFVKRFYASQDPVGQHFGIDDPKYSGAFEIVGVFRDFKMNNPRNPVRPVFLRPLSQYLTAYKEPQFISTEKQSMYADAIIVDFSRTPQNPDTLLRNALASIDPNLTVVDLRTFQAQIEGNFDQERLLAQLTGLFGVLALVLASVGLYGVMSYFVARRTGEIGIRMALGATRASVVGIVMRGAGLQVGLGLLLGIPAALLAGHLMASQLYGVGAYDPAAFTGATLVLAGCAAIAGFIPARRAASIEPMQALRIE
ncbi:MAG TPA: ABC transporter permease [Terracidiphilus sp.]|jgi:predicted permease|nr:ABC transporter permease [Terracidiphilus sp.]